MHLSLGYGSIIFALGGMAYVYAYKLSFKASRPALLVAVVGYFTLQTLLWAWKRWVEQGEVFRGKRRRLVKRVCLLMFVFPGIAERRQRGGGWRSEGEWRDC